VSGVRNYLRRYWFGFEGGGLGCGATGIDQRDAEELVRAAVFAGGTLPAVVDVIEDVDVRELDRGHVLPNMGDPSVRGVWYPRVWRAPA
jgi:hypothetical protein